MSSGGRVREERIRFAGPGGALATALAGRGAPVAGLVLLVGAARSGEQVLLWQVRATVGAGAPAGPDRSMDTGA